MLTVGYILYISHFNYTACQGAVYRSWAQDCENMQFSLLETSPLAQHWEIKSGANREYSFTSGLGS